MINDFARYIDVHSYGCRRLSFPPSRLTNLFSTILRLNSNAKPAQDDKRACLTWRHWVRHPSPTPSWSCGRWRDIRSRPVTWGIRTGHLVGPGGIHRGALITVGTGPRAPPGSTAGGRGIIRTSARGVRLHGRGLGLFIRGLDDGKGCKVGRFEIGPVHAQTETGITCGNLIFHRVTSFGAGPPEFRENRVSFVNLLPAHGWRDPGCSKPELLSETIRKPGFSLFSTKTWIRVSVRQYKFLIGWPMSF
jgi:hypothetical protein